MLNNDHLQGQLITRRTFIIAAGKIGLLFLLAGRMFYMQFLKKDEYKTLSDKNRIKTILIPPLRGQIYDASDKILAKNNTCFRLLLDKTGISASKYKEEILLVASLLELDEEQTNEMLARVKKASGRLPAMLLDFANWQQVSVIEERKSDLKAVFVDTGYVRFYPYGKSTSHLLGYMGKGAISEPQNLELSDDGFRVGKNGIEQYYESDLRGEFGYKQIEVNAYGNYVRQLAINDSKEGEDLYLNIDAELQEIATNSLSPLGGSAILMDTTNGNVLVLASSPCPDPNKFSQLSNKYWQELMNDPHKPLINKTINSLYPPGSVFKIITALAGLEAGIDPEDRFTCTGAPVIGGNFFRCHMHSGHGSLCMTEGLKRSCNSYFFNLARRIGPEKIMEVAIKFGLGDKTGIDMPGELSGFVPSVAWKKEKSGNKWSLGDSLNLAIGQGFLLVTPIQLARLITAIASDGKLFTPRVAKNSAHFTQIDLAPSNLNFIKNALYDVMNKEGGTGYFSRIHYKSMQMSGKTGTAQVQGKKHANDDLSRADIAWDRRNHALFSGYAPSNNPKYAVSVYFDHGGAGGRAAAPIAQKIMQAALEKWSG